jgi:hypothetical protein
MDTHENPPRRPRRGAELAALQLTAAAGRAPDAFSSAGAVQIPEQRPDEGERRDGGRDCPEKDGAGSGSDSAPQTISDDVLQAL